MTDHKMTYHVKTHTKQLLSAISIAASVAFAPALLINQAQASEVLVDMALSAAAANRNNVEETTIDSNVSGGEAEESNSGELQGYLKVGLGYKSEISPYTEEVEGLSLFINGRYDWHGFFLESYYGANERNEGVSIGYNFYNYENWSFDVNTMLAHGETKSEIYDVDKILIHKRDSTTMLALRATGYFDDDVSLQVQFAPYSFNQDHKDGYVASAWLGKAWFLKNWEINTSVGVRYYSADFLDYYYGISEEEATRHFAAYTPDDGFNVTGQVSASYPISENWLFESYFKYTDLSDEIIENSIMDFAKDLPTRQEHITEFGVLVSYVF